MKCRNNVAAVALVTTVSLYLAIVASSMSQVVINEVFYDPPGKDIGCFVELMGVPGFNLNGCFLIGVNGEGGKQYNRIDLSGYTIPADGYFVVAQDKKVNNADMINSKVDFQNGPDNIELWHGNKKLDSVGYGDFSDAVFSGEGKPTFDLSGYSIGRRPDGADIDNNIADFVGLPRLSPGAPNTPYTALPNGAYLADIWAHIKSSSSGKREQ